MLITDKHIFFYTNFLSNFHKTSFVWEAFGQKHTFFCTEQAFMWAKAMYFNDKTTAEKILQEKEDPLKCKRLGRLVSNYDDKKWDLVREDMMFQVNLCKYQQDDEMQKLILNPQFEGKTFVEADTIHFSNKIANAQALIKQAKELITPVPVNYKNVYPSGWVEQN